MPQNEEKTKTCADINKAAADARGNLPSFQKNIWRYNDVGALRLDRARAQYALNEASFIADATSFGGLGVWGKCIALETSCHIYLSKWTREPFYPKELPNFYKC